MMQHQQEVQEQLRSGQAVIVPWDDIKADPPKNMKIHPLAMIPHKTRDFRALLDLSFETPLPDGTKFLSVNQTTTKLAPKGSVDQLGHVLQRIIHAVAEAKPEETLFMAKWDVKDGFWQLRAKTGE